MQDLNLLSYQFARLHREMLERQAENHRLLTLLNVDARQPRLLLHRAVLAWTGRRMMASGRYLVRVAENASADAPAIRIERA